MSVTVSVEARTTDERLALESEGAPETNMGSGTWREVCSLYGHHWATNPDGGSSSPDGFLYAYEAAVQAANRYGDPLVILRVEEVRAVAAAAQALGRRVVWG